MGNTSAYNRMIHAGESDISATIEGVWSWGRDTCLCVIVGTEADVFLHVRRLRMGAREEHASFGCLSPDVCGSASSLGSRASVLFR